MLNEATKISYKIAYSCCWAVASTGNKKKPKLIFLILILAAQTISSYQIFNFAHK